MELIPHEKSKLLISTAVLLAERREDRGLKLNHPEATASISVVIMEDARDGRTVTDLMHYGTTFFTCNDVMDEVAKTIPDIQVEAMLPNGTKLVIAHHPIVWVLKLEVRTPLITASPAMMPTLSRFARPATAIVLMFGAPIAFVRPRHLGHTAEDSLLAGFLHSFTDADHLPAMMTVGAWSVLAPCLVCDTLWASVIFITLMILGALSGTGGVTVPVAESITVASLLVFGLLTAACA